VKFQSQLIHILFLIFLLPVLGLAQYNTSVEANILVVENTEFTELKASAKNVTEVNQDLSFIFSIIRTPSEGDVVKTKKEGGFNLAPFTSKILAETTINKRDSAKIIVLFLIYDASKHLIGKARWSQNEEEAGAPVVIEKEELAKMAYESAVMRGIVTEDTRTKPGRDFYKLFYSEYFLSQWNADEVISIRELLAFGRNTKIEVKIGSTVVYQFYLRPSEDFLKKAVKVTMANIARYLQNKKNMDQQIQKY
jgi:hypothetical protein